MLWKRLTLWIVSLLLGITVCLLSLELLLRMLPVHEGTYRLPVNEENPMLHFQPNRQFIWSKGWNFEMVNEVRTNNFGFISDVDYEKGSPNPLLAVIGDSYVEAIMVPYKNTAAGRLAEYLGKRSAVYSFAASGAPLSQYLAYSEYVRRIFQPDGMVIIVIGNDFDESLKKYKAAPGYHYFVENSHGEYRLERVDFSPSFLTKLGRMSALIRYLAINLELQARLKRLSSLIEQKESVPFVGNTAANTDSRRVVDSKHAIDAFFKELPTKSGLSATKILFVVDGMRPHLYDDNTLESAKGSYFDVMRRYFITAATERGYEVVDMQPVFREHYEQQSRRFEFSQDMHWNPLGHELCYEVIIQSNLLSRFSGHS